MGGICMQFVIGEGWRKARRDDAFSYKSISIRITKDQYDYLNLASKARKKTFSELIRELIENEKERTPPTTFDSV